MKTKTWIILLGAAFLILAGVVLLQRLNAKPASSVEVWSEGKLYRTLDLSQDGVLRVETDRGWNEITVKKGRVSVTAASCPDGDCVRCGEKNSGVPIVCLPNRLSLRFSDGGGLDGVSR